MRPFTPPSRTFNELCRYLGLPETHPELFITGITSNSRYLEEGDLFVGLPGLKQHGALFAAQAKSQGAVALLTDSAGSAIGSASLPTVEIQDVRRRAGDVSAWIYDFPFGNIFTVGITGTNGKTTTASLLHQFWQLEHREVGFIGTTGVSIGNQDYATSFTTPEASELQQIVATMREQHVTHMVMEVSSHALDQSRVSGAHFSLSAFSNLTQDHLDYHGSMESYYAAKAKLFTSEYSDLALVNIDDSYGLRLSQEAGIPIITVSRFNTAANWHYVAAVEVTSGFEISIRGEGGVLIEGLLPLIGDHNLDNALLAIALAYNSGVDPIAIAAYLPKLGGVPGRLEKIDVGQDFRALVDFAHTPDAVERILQTLQKSSAQRVIGVLGCGGDRDRTKRPIMGKLLLELADIAIFTSDNPRSENPGDILQEMTAGLEIVAPSIVQVDRAAAIRYAVSQARTGDSVVVLGKGHELGQEINGVKYPFDDRIELAKAIEGLE